MTRRRGARWLMWQRDSGGGAPDAEALLNEADVRFDFSQYTDVNDMVDVNGGWGPIVPDFTMDDHEFTVDGLHLTGTEVRAEWNIENVPSPVVMGPDGFTIVDVVTVGAPFTNKRLMTVDAYGDVSGLAANFGGFWSTIDDDAYGAILNDAGPGFEQIVDGEALTGADSQSAGTYIYAAAFDVVAEEVRVTAVGPGVTVSETYPFASSPVFPALALTLDGIFYGAAENPGDHTLVEHDIWSRALTPAEVDALIAHFTPEPEPEPDAEALLNEADVRFDFSQYSDVNDMVDVNGGWGPLVPILDGQVIEFTADGLHLTNDVPGEPSDRCQLVVEGESSSLSLIGADGLTVVTVHQLNAPITGISQFGVNVNFVGDGLGAYAPDVSGGFRCPLVQDDTAYAYLSDLESMVIIDAALPLGSEITDSTTGTFIYAVTYDAVAQEARVRLVGPLGDFADTVPFESLPDFGAPPRLADTVYYGGQPSVAEQTFVEMLAWNRALSPAEVDALVAHFTPEPDPVHLLLDEAAVRFDFSQYSDVNDMVDVNGGWGPLVTFFGADSSEFTTEGLHLTDDVPVIPAASIEGESGPLVLGPDGLTLVKVMRIAAPGDGLFFGGDEVVGDALGAFSPWVRSRWKLPVGDGDLDSFEVYVEDGGDVVDDAGDSDLSSRNVEGVFISIVVVDAAGEETRLTFVSPVGRFDHASPFGATPGFATTPSELDAFYMSSWSAPPDVTLIESDAWNRALTEAEIDALVAHFTA